MTDTPDHDAADPTNTLIGANVVVRGDIEGATDLHVRGRVLGNVAVTGVIIDEGAEIDGSVTAQVVVTAGHINGAVDANAVHVRSTGLIDGDVSYASLQIDSGGRLAGRLTIASEATPIDAKLSEARARSAKPKSDLAESGQELVRLAARMRRVSE